MRNLCLFLLLFFASLAVSGQELQTKTIYVRKKQSEGNELVSNSYRLPATGKRETPKVRTQYPGGADSLDAFIKRNARFPMEAKLANAFTYRYVYVRFTVNEEGKLEGLPEDLPGVGDACDHEALRVARLLPNWIPAIDKQGNKMATDTLIKVWFGPGTP